MDKGDTMNQRITDIDYLKKSETYAMQMRPAGGDMIRCLS